MNCAAERHAAKRALSSLSPVANATATRLDGRRVLELTIDDSRCVPVAVMQVASAYGLRVDADHTATRAGCVLTVVLR